MAKAISTDDFSSAVQTILNGTKNYVDSLPTATETNNGLMSSDQVKQLNNVENLLPSYNGEPIKLIINDSPDAEDINITIAKYLEENPINSNTSNLNDTELLNFIFNEKTDRIQLSEKRLGTIIPTFDSGKIFFILDDSNSDISTAKTIFDNHNMVFGVAAIPDRLTNTADDGNTILDVLKAIQNAGGEIWAHGGTTMNGMSYEECEDYLKSTKMTLMKNGLKITGWIAPEGYYNSAAKDLYQKYYNYGYFASDEEGSVYRIYRTNMTNTSLADIKSKINTCIANKSYLCLMCHNVNGKENGFTTANLEDILNYIETTTAQVTTFRNLYASMSPYINDADMESQVNAYLSKNPPSGMSTDQVNKLKQKVYYFNTVSAMLSCTYLENGDMCITKGFHAINDGGGAEYTITTGETADGYFVLNTVVTNLQAKIIIQSRKCNVRQLGAKGDGSSDDTAAIQAALSTWYVQVIYLPRGTYCVTGLTLTSSTRVIEGDGYWVTTIKCIAEKDCDILYLDNHGAYMGTIRQLRIQGNSSYKQNGLNVKPSDAGTSSFTVDYVNIENCKGVGLYIQTYSGRAAYHCNFTNLILQSNGVGADVTLNDGTLANFYCYQSQTIGINLAGFNCRISNGKIAQNSYSTPGASTTYPALSISGSGCVFNNIDIQENCGIGLLTDDHSRNMYFNNVILDMNGIDRIPALADTTSSKPWAYLAGFFHYGNFLIKNYVTTNPATSIIQSYYSGKIEVSYMDSTTNQAHLLPYAKEVALLPCKDQDFNINVTSGYTPTYSILYGTKKGLSLPADKYLTISPFNFITGDSFHLMVTFQINYSESSLTTYQDILKLGSFYSVYANSGNIKINGAGNVSFSSGDILRFACSGITQKGNTENIYNMIYKYNTATGTFEQITSISISNASYLTQSDFTLTLGTKLRTENPSLSIKYCDVAFGHGLVSEQMSKFILSPVLHDQCNYYMPLNGDLTCGGVPSNLIQ